MAANDYYNTAGQGKPRPYDNSQPSLPQLPPLPHDDFDPYNSHQTQQPSPYGSPISPIHDAQYRPYEHSQHSASSPYYASGGGGRDNEPNPFSDEIPLRESPSKTSGDTATFQDHLPEDPAVMDALPASQSRERKRRKKGIMERKIPWVVYTFTFVQIVVFIAELIKAGVLTGSPIEIHPIFNPMIGPSPYVLINMGARFPLCMRLNHTVIEDPIAWPCPNATVVPPVSNSTICALNNLCGFGDGPYSMDHPPNQWFRFIIPMFLHAGFIHISFNMLLQILLGREMEKEIGSIRFFVVYVSSGIFGFVLGGNFAQPGVTSTGASGSLFGIIAILLLDLLYHWGERRNPWIDLAWILADIIISLCLGLLPGLDNFSHIGGFLMGLVLGVCLLHTPDVLRRRVGADHPPYASVRQARKAMDTGGIKGFVKDPIGFFKGRKPFWWAWWLVRAAALLGVLVGFIVLVKDFYRDPPLHCSWCYRLSCLPINGWCDIGNLKSISSNKTTKRDTLFGSGSGDMAPVFLGNFMD